MKMLRIFALVGLTSILPTTIYAELLLVQGQHGASLEGSIGDHRLRIGCTPNWGSQGLANFMIEPQTDAANPDLAGVSEFRFRFDMPEDLPIALQDGVADWTAQEVEEFNDRLFWDVPITDALSQQFAYAHSLTVDFTSQTGQQSVKLVMDRPGGTLVGPTGSAWNGYLDNCKSRR